MGIMSIVWMIIVGFIVGLLARFFYPGAINMGFWMTTLFGIGGSLVGGVIASLIWKSRDGKFTPAGWFLSIIGAMLLIWGYLNLRLGGGHAARLARAARPRRQASSELPSSRAASCSSGRKRRFSSSVTSTRDACVPMFIAATTLPARLRTGTAMERSPSSSSWSTIA